MSCWADTLAQEIQSHSDRHESIVISMSRRHQVGKIIFRPTTLTDMLATRVISMAACKAASRTASAAIDMARAEASYMFA